MTKMACPFEVITEKVVVQILFDCMAYSRFHTAAQDDELKRLRRKTPHMKPQMHQQPIDCMAGDLTHE